MTCHGDEGRRRAFAPIGGESDAARQKGAERGESLCVCRELKEMPRAQVVVCARAGE